MKLQDKVAIITGAGSGIGQATALLFAQEGARVVIADRNQEGGASTARLIAEAEGECLWQPTDVSQSADVRHLVEHTVARFGRIDVLVNNAGIGGAAKKFTELSEAEWDEVLAVNLRGHFLCARYVAPVMVANGGGVIVNTSSVLATLALPHTTAYCTSKAAILGFTKALALDLARDRVRVNCLVPGSVDTPLMWEGLSASERQAVEPLVADAEPLGRIAAPGEIARAALFLACEDSSFVTGAPLVVDGGLLSKIAAPR